MALTDGYGDGVNDVYFPGLIPRRLPAKDKEGQAITQQPHGEICDWLFQRLRGKIEDAECARIAAELKSKLSPC